MTEEPLDASAQQHGDSPRWRSRWLEHLSGALVAATTFTALELLVLYSGLSAPPPEQAGLVEVAALWGHAIVCFVGVGCVLACAALLYERFLSRHRRGALWATVVLTVALLPYFLYVAHYALSGPSIRAVPYRLLLIAATTLALCALGALANRWIVQRMTEARLNRWAIVGELLLGAMTIWINSAYLPNEYEVLHAFVTFTGIVAISLFGLEIARLRRLPMTLPAISVVALLVVLGAVGGQVALMQSEAARWFVFGESPASRYVPVDWNAETTSEDGEHTPGAAPEKPRLPESARATRRRAERFRKAPPHIVVFSIDNLQADRIGANGYSGNPSTPNIDRLASRGASFRNAYSYYPGTRVFLTSMLLGRRLPNFGAHHMPPAYQQQALTRLLSQRGYHVLVMGVFELTASRRFNPKDYAIDTNLRRATPEEIRKSGTIPHIPYEERFRHIRRHLLEADAHERPAFLWLHWLKPHRFRGSFVGSKDFDFGSDIDALYDASVADTDALIPKIEGLMQQILGTDREVLWIIMSDHGAGLTRGPKKETGKTLYEDQVHVPLIFSGAGIEPATYDILVDSAVDTPATILDWVGVTAPAAYDGVSLIPVLDGTAPSGAFDDRLIALHSKDWTGAVYRRHKLIVRKGAKSLYDLEADPLERKNRADEKKKLLRTMHRRSKVELARNRRLYEAGLEAGKAAQDAAPLGDEPE